MNKEQTDKLNHEYSKIMFGKCNQQGCSVCKQEIEKIYVLTLCLKHNIFFYKDCFDCLKEKGPTKTTEQAPIPHSC